MAGRLHGGWQLETGTEVDKGVLGAGALSDPDGPCSHTLSIGHLPSGGEERPDQGGVECGDAKTWPKVSKDKDLS